jgi:exodeoxyribonuclease-3
VRLFSWNVNGIRAAWRGGLARWLRRERPDVVCIQEVKAHPDDLPEGMVHPLGYQSFWHPARKIGYSGVTTYTRLEPLAVSYGMGRREFDDEGRVLFTEFERFVLVNAYFPNSGRDHSRLEFKLRFCQAIARRLNRMRRAGKNVVMCGDYNIAHQAIDLRNPTQNRNNAGFLPEERAWMTRFLRRGYIDAFRYFCDEPGHYTWWSYRPTVRERNIGWRVDYFCVNAEFEGALARAFHQPKVLGSDHCPIGLELRL